jgi:hypothetical protein
LGAIISNQFKPQFSKPMKMKAFGDALGNNKKNALWVKGKSRGM